MLPSYPEPLRRAFARNLLRNTLRLKRSENLLIETWSGTLPWAVSLDLEARLLGARPLLSVKDEPSYWRSLSGAPASQLARLGSHELAALSSSDAYVSLFGPADTLREERLPPSAARRIESNTHEIMRVIQKYGIRCVRWDLGRTNEVWARRYAVNLRAWRNELIDAALVDTREMQRDGARIGRLLERGHEATITHPNGTHLVLRLAHRRAKVDDGVIDEADVKAGNMMMVVPTGVVGATVDELHGDGPLVSNVTGVLFAQSGEIPLGPGKWVFRQGALETFAAAHGGAQLRRALVDLHKPVVRPGLFSVGLNQHISSIPLLFDQSRGTIALEFGRNAHLGGRSRSPHLVAYVALTGADLRIDGTSVVKQGRVELAS